MADDFISIQVRGLEELQRAVRLYPQQSAKYLQGAGREAATKAILPTEGLAKYPPETSANLPPPPFYIRGVGTQTRSGNKGNSERLGTQFTVQPSGMFSTQIANRASYAPFVVGDDQASFMAPIGWRKLREVAEEKIPEIVAIYEGWIDKLLVKIGMR